MSAETRAHHAMAAVGGFFGLYALLTRGGTFGSSETSNLIYLVVSGLDGSWGAALVRLGGTVSYIAGIVLAVLWRRRGRMRRLRFGAILLDLAACLALAWIPPETDPILALYPMFFVTAVQWVAFTQADGFSCATIFSTNNLRQCFAGLAEYLHSRQEAQRKRFFFYGGTLICFHLGVIFCWYCMKWWGIKSIYACLFPISLGAAATFLDVRSKASETA